MRILRRVSLVTVAVAVLSMSVVASATADRPASGSETEAMVADWDFDPDCVDARISTADLSWGAFTATNADGCPGASGFVIVRLAGAAWSSAFQGSTNGGACEQIGVPTNVGVDLGVCSPASSRRYMACAKGFGSSKRLPLVSRPSTCTNGGIQTSMAELWILKQLHWSSWGGSQARGSGYKYAAHYYPGYSGRPVTVEAFGISYSCGRSKPFYTRIRITGKAWEMRSKPFGGGAWQTTPMPAFSYVVKTYAAKC